MNNSPSPKFDIGQRVRLTLAPEIETIVAAYCVRGGGNISYECCWIHEGKQLSGWFVEAMLADPDEAKRIGFRGGKKSEGPERRRGLQALPRGDV